MDCLPSELLQKLGCELFKYDDLSFPIYEPHSIILSPMERKVITEGFIYYDDSLEDFYKLKLVTYYNKFFGNITEVTALDNSGFQAFHGVYDQKSTVLYEITDYLLELWNRRENS